MKKSLILATQYSKNINDLQTFSGTMTCHCKQYIYNNFINIQFICCIYVCLYEGMCKRNSPK